MLLYGSVDLCSCVWAHFGSFRDFQFEEAQIKGLFKFLGAPATYIHHYPSLSFFLVLPLLFVDGFPIS